MDRKIYYLIEIEYILIYMNYISPMKLSEFKISILADSYDGKTAENYRNSYVAEKRIVSIISKISISYFDETN